MSYHNMLRRVALERRFDTNSVICCDDVDIVQQNVSRRVNVDAIIVGHEIVSMDV